MKGYIKLGKPTQGHCESLEKLGYEVQEVDGHLEVEVTGFVESIDLTQGSDVLQELIQDRKALTYSTRAIVPTIDEDGSESTGTVFGFPLARKLGKLSCLMMKSKRGSGKKKTESLFSLDDFVV